LGIGSIQPRPYVEYIQIFIFANQLQLDREYFLTRTAWAVFKYCGTTTV
jgi:hypothetical protein